MTTRIRLIAALAVLAATLSPARPAVAFAQAAFPTVSLGNRGYDVQAVQYLLRQHGYRVSIDAIFGPATRSAATSFQRARGIGADGIVGPVTWGRLIVTLGQGDRGLAVRALQAQLNQKRSAGLAVDGVFGRATRDAVIAFQRHAGISADGVVGPVTWRNLLWHFERLGRGGNVCAYSPSGEQWGTSVTVFQLERAAERFARAHNGQIAVGDLGLEHGGDIAGHASHEVGMDADVRPPRTDAAQCSAITRWDASSYDRAATRAMVDAIRAMAPGRVRVIWFNDPVLRREGRTQYLSGHDDHLHVRYCVQGHPNSLYNC